MTDGVLEGAPKAWAALKVSLLLLSQHNHYFPQEEDPKLFRILKRYHDGTKFFHYELLTTVFEENFYTRKYVQGPNQSFRYPLFHFKQ